LENLKGRGNSEDLGVDGKIILECRRKAGREDADWIYLALGRD
jgi:hypothetical protein